MNIHNLHIDIFDSVYLNSLLAFMFGPIMLHHMSKYVCWWLAAQDGYKGYTNNTLVNIEVKMDVHMYVHNPLWFIESIANASAT